MITHETILDPVPGSPSGYVTKDLVWAAVPFGKKFMIIHNGQQGDVFRTLDAAKKYIDKQIKTRKSKKGSASLEEFL